MARSKSFFAGPRVRRIRLDQGLTQKAMAEQLDVSPSYIALIERNQRPLSADLLVKLSKVFGINFADLDDDSVDTAVDRLVTSLQDPLFGGLDVTPTELTDFALNHPALADALVRSHGAYKDSQVSLADRQSLSDRTSTPLEQVRAFLASRRNYFPVLDDQAEKLAAEISRRGSIEAYMEAAHGYSVVLYPPDVMHGMVRRLDYHRRQVCLDDTLDSASRNFQLVLQLVYLEFDNALDVAVREASFTDENSQRIGRRALANYAAGATLLPYTPFYREAERRRYDITVLSRVFGCSFEQVAHRLTSLQKPGYQGIPFFFIRIDAAGNVSKRFDGADFPFARHGGSCPRWSLHHTFKRPREIITELVELPDGERFVSIARTVTSGGGAFGSTVTERALALGCDISHADRLVYADSLNTNADGAATPIGATCRLCQRTECTARAEPPLGRQLLSDDNRRLVSPFGFSDS